MQASILLKRVEGVELWRSVSGSIESYAVKCRNGRARVVTSLHRAEELLKTWVDQARLARAH